MGSFSVPRWARCPYIHITGLQEISLPATAVQTQLSSTAAFFGCGSNLSCQKTPCDTTQSPRLGFPQLLGWLQSSRSHSFALYHPPLMHQHHPPSTYYIKQQWSTAAIAQSQPRPLDSSDFLALVWLAPPAGRIILLVQCLPMHAPNFRFERMPNLSEPHWVTDFKFILNATSYAETEQTQQTASKQNFPPETLACGFGAHAPADGVC